MASITKYVTSRGEQRYRVQYRTPDGRLTQQRGFKRKKDAEDFAATTHVSKLRGEYIDPAASRITVAELAPAWLANQQATMKPSGFRSYESAWRNHVQPRWGRVQLGDIRPTAVRSWVAEMNRTEVDDDGTVTKRGSSPKTVARALGVLAGILADAVDDRRILMNPARGIKLPRHAPGDHQYLTEDQVWQLAEQAANGRAGRDKGTIVLLLAYTGIRWGELAGLHVGDFDTLRRRLHVRRNAVNVGGVIEVGTPKTHERRVIAFPRFLVEPLAAACRGKGRDAIVFPAADGGYAKSPGASTWFDGAVKRCQHVTTEARAAERKARPDADPGTPEFPRVTPHDLRHTAASLAVSAGANVKAVQKMLGHASAAMTLDVYADLFDTDAEAVAAAHDERLAGRMFSADVAKM